jgi:4-phosphopantoate--beta-alanine ligase
MTRLSKSHPRYRSLLTRARLADAARAGIVVPEGLIAQGRGEAFDYLLGERTTPSASEALRVAADWLRSAEHPVISVNGNVAALAAPDVAALARALPSLAVEVNLFHRTPARARAVAAVLRRAGVPRVLGVRPTRRIAGLPSDRAWVDADGIWTADVCLVPLEDGDRAAALRRTGKRVIAIDLNPLSRTARTADLTIVDELSRALRGLVLELRRPARPRPSSRRAAARNARLLAAAVRTMQERLSSAAREALPRPPAARRERAGRRPPAGRGRRSGRRRSPRGRPRRSPQ